MRLQNERVGCALFVNDDESGLEFAEDRQVVVADSIGAFFRRTATPDQFTFHLRNGNALLSRSVDWAVIGITP